MDLKGPLQLHLDVTCLIDKIKKSGCMVFLKICRRYDYLYRDFNCPEQKFDEAYGPAWHCVVGKDFGSCITHLCGSFIFFHVEIMEFLIFKDGTDSCESREEAIGVLQNGSLSD